jgi:hypothetical protein
LNNKSSLSDRFIAPPFSILDSKQAYWQQRKKQWLALGIESELGRDAESFTTFNSAYTYPTTVLMKNGRRV